MHNLLDLRIGDILSAVAVCMTIIAKHKADTKRLQSLESKVDIMYDWFVNNVINRVK